MILRVIVHAPLILSLGISETKVKSYLKIKIIRGNAYS